MNNTALKRTMIGIVGTVGMAAFSGFSLAASFDCTKASTKVEKLICADEKLSVLDEQLSTVYKKSLEVSGDKDSFKKEQFAWLKTRNICGDVACLARSYQTRVNALGQSATELSPKHVITFTLVEGEGYPLCKEYVDMLNKTQYTEMPVCSRKILPEFKNFQEIVWTEITDKEEMIKITKERMAVQAALNPTHSKQLYDPVNRIKPINENRLRMYAYKIQMNDDGVVDIVYRNHVQPKNYKNKYGHCPTVNNFYVDDSKITIKSIKPFTADPYSVFNARGSSELFIYGDNLYISIYQGTSYYRTNLDVYGAGNRKMCGILAK